MDLDKMVERAKGKFHESERRPEDDLIKAALFEIVNERTDDLSGDTLYVRAKQRAMEKMRESESLSLPHTPTDRILGDAIVRALAPKIEELRMAGFGEASAPFSTLAEASAWIEQESEKIRGWCQGQNEERKAASKRIGQLAREHGLEIERKATSLVYQREGDDHVKNAPTVPGSYLYRLARETRNMAKRTGFPQDALTMYILTDLKPKRGRVRIATREHSYTLPSGEQIHTNDATVTFRALDLKDEELRRIYGYIRGGTGGKGAKGLTDRDEYLWTLVQDAGGPPSKHGEKGKFWRRIREKMKAKYPDAPSTTNGIEQNYSRILRVYKPTSNT